MFIPTDFQLKRNVLSYNINTGRIFFVKEFWDHYSSQLIKDFRIETGLELVDKKKFFCEIKRSLFEYYFYKIDKNIHLEHSLYHQLTLVFQKHSKNGLPKLVVDFKKQVPVYYDDEYKIEDPVEITYDSTHHKSESQTVSVSSITDVLHEVESSQAFTLNCNQSFSQDADHFLKQFLCEQELVSRLRSDYESGLLDKYIDISENKVTFDDIMKIVKRIFDHYEGDIGFPTIFNVLNFADIDDGKSNLRFSSRFDLWHKNYTIYDTYRQLVFYIGYDICDFLFTSFLKTRRCHYKTGYEYVFCCILFKDLSKKISLLEEKEQFPKFVHIRSKIDANKKNANIFNDDRNSIVFGKVIDRSIPSSFGVHSSSPPDSPVEKTVVKKVTQGFSFGNPSGSRKNTGFFK